MEITTIAEIGLAANGWAIVGDQMAASNAPDNWHPQRIAVSRDYPVINRITLEQRAMTRDACVSNMRAMLRALEQQSEELWRCRMIASYNSAGWMIYIEPLELLVSPLLTDGTRYIQRLTITFRQLFPPISLSDETISLTNMFGFSSFGITFPSNSTNPSTWVPGKLSLSVTHSIASVAVFITNLGFLTRSWPATSGWTSISYGSTNILHNNSGSPQSISATVSGGSGLRQYYAVIVIPDGTSATVTVTTPYGNQIVQVTPRQHYYFLFDGRNVSTYTISGTFPNNTYLYPMILFPISEQSHMYVSPIGNYTNPSIVLTHPLLATSLFGCYISANNSVMPLTPNVWFYTRQGAVHYIAFTQTAFNAATRWSITASINQTLLGLL